MTNSVPAPFDLSPRPAIGDLINSDGVSLAITAVVRTDNGLGFINYHVTLSNSVTLDLTYANCVLESKPPVAVNGDQTQPNVWKQTANA